MTDVREAPDVKVIRPLRTLGTSGQRRPGTLSPDPWHFSLFASSMIQGPGDASTMTASPMPPACGGARGACRRSPILRSGTTSVPVTSAVSQRRTEPLYHAAGPMRQMPGAWGQRPQPRHVRDKSMDCVSFAGPRRRPPNSVMNSKKDATVHFSD